MGQLSRLPADPFTLAGSTLDGRYRVDRVVGEGGFGVVYRGFHLSFEQPIAIKCLKVPPHFTPEAKQLFLDRFREEGKHLARLAEHPSIVRLTLQHSSQIGGAASPSSPSYLASPRQPCRKRLRSLPSPTIPMKRSR